MKDLLDLDRYPIDRPDSPESVRFTERCTGFTFSREERIGFYGRPA